MVSKSLTVNPDYGKFLADLKTKIRSAQIKAALSVNNQLIRLYWEIGQEILKKQKEAGWGAKIIDQLAKDLSVAFPDMKGFSPSNLKYMRRFAEEYPGLKIGQQPADQLPWWHNVILMTKVKNLSERIWYAEQTLENGWSRNILSLQIDSKLYHRQGKALTNFKTKLPPLQSDLAEQTLKDPYIFDFLSVGREAHEREIEKELVQHITKFLLELGTGFSFVRQQYRLEIGGEDYYIDLLFYHVKLHCYVVIELKAGKFKPEYAGQINFYLSAVDELLRSTSDNPSIGIILCRDKNRAVAEYPLRDVSKPIGVSEYQIGQSIPEKLKTSLPTVNELEEELMNFQELEGFPYKGYLVKINKWIREGMLECWITPHDPFGSAGDKIALVEIKNFSDEKKALEHLRKLACEEIDQRVVKTK